MKFHSKITLADISINCITSFLEEYQIYCFCLILPYGNTITECNVFILLGKIYDISTDFPTSENTCRQQNCYQNVTHHQNNVFPKTLCVPRVSKTLKAFPLLNNFARNYQKAYFKLCWRISNIFFLLDTNLWQHYCIVLCFQLF